MATIPFHLTSEALVRMKLNSYRRNDQMHLLDMIDVGVLDGSCCDRFQPVPFSLN
ncbi:MAG TPA: hypothetical protein VGH74_09815 [Planctomycetaceae bacterium]|jgi:hypothetical protein